MLIIYAFLNRYDTALQLVGDSCNGSGEVSSKLLNNDGKIFSYK